MQLRASLVVVLGLTAAGALACSPPNVAGPALAAPNAPDAFGTGKCDASQPLREPDLMAWDSTSRAALAAVRRQGIAVVHYEANGCDAHLELLSSCIAKGKYDFVPYWESRSKLVENQADLYSKLPIGAATLSGELSGNRSLRTDYMLAGLVQTQIGSNFRIEDLVGDCARATHLVTRIYLGGFAMAAGDKRSIEATISLFSAGAGGSTAASLRQLDQAGDAGACDASHKSQSENVDCAVPLRIGLLSLARARPCSDPSECQSRCMDEDAPSCVVLGAMYSQGNDVPPNPQQAATMYKKACDLGDENGCANLGALYLGGRGVQQDDVRAWQLLNEPCNKGITWACGYLGMMYEQGIATRPDPVRAAELYGKACDGGAAEACTRRIPLLKAECDAGQAEDCWNLGKMYASGSGVPTDYAMALKLLTSACDHGSEDACTEVGTFYVRGLGVAKDVEKGMAVYKEACDHSMAGPCLALGAMYYGGEAVDKNYKLAFAAFERGCTFGNAVACGELGSLYEDGNGVKKNLTKALSLYTQSCDGNAPAGCASLGGFYEDGTGVRADTQRAIALYRQACEGGLDDACRAAQRLSSTQK
jgi:TPR repeat protein